MVENRFVGIKSRGVYETPGATILYAAHRDLEGIAMDREVMRLRNMLTPEFAELIYNGFWFSPEMDFLMAAIDKSQELIDGSVHLCLYKGNIFIEGRESPSSLYDKNLSSMDIEGGFDQTDSRGFIRINAIRLMAHRAIVESGREKRST
jgi:argininosuccinate synthase